MSKIEIQKEKGFTIVELLIVIVVIAILAAISIVAYNGIQSRAKTTAGQQLANQIVKKIELYQASTGSYPIGGITASSLSSVDEAKVDDTSILKAAASPTNSTSSPTVSTSDGKFVSVWGCATGAHVWYYNYTTSAVQTAVKAGSGC